MSHPKPSDGHQGHGSVKSYVIGLILCIILTVIPFGLVMAGTLTKITLITVIVIAAILQVYVQLAFFMHMDSSEEQHWNMLSLFFSLIVIFVVVGGSIWIMSELNYFMM